MRKKDLSKLNEVMDNPFNWKLDSIRRDGELYTFEASFETDEGIEYEYNFNFDLSVAKDKLLLGGDIVFANEDVEFEKSVDVTGDGNAFRVFATVLDITNTVFKKKDKLFSEIDEKYVKMDYSDDVFDRFDLIDDYIGFIKFSASGGSKVKLYDKIIERFFNKFGMNLVDREETPWGDVDYLMLNQRLDKSYKREIEKNLQHLNQIPV